LHKMSRRNGLGENVREQVFRVDPVYHDIAGRPLLSDEDAFRQYVTGRFLSRRIVGVWDTCFVIIPDDRRTDFRSVQIFEEQSGPDRVLYLRA
jgi:hypothetical protein